MATLDLTVAAGADDAHETDFGAGFSSSLNEVFASSNTGSTSRYNGGFRFTNVTIPQGETITAAYLTVQPISTSADDANVDILAEDVDNAVDFSTNADVTSRVRTTASVAWVQDSLGAADVNSPEIKTVIQEVIDRPGWASGNAMVILMDGKSNVNKTFQVKSRDSSATLCARLHIEYGSGGGARTQVVVAG